MSNAKEVTPMRAKHTDRQVPTEFWLYFALVFIVLLPIAAVKGFLRLVLPIGGGDGDQRWFVGDAWAAAWRITPQIFSSV